MSRILTAGPARDAQRLTGVPLAISRAERLAFTGASGPARDPDLRRYLTDLVGPYGLALHDADLARGTGHSYGEMAEALITAVLPGGEPVDLLVLAFAVPDVWPGRATASYLSHVCPGAPMAFAVCDQGRAAAFTGLRLAGEYARSAGCQRALLLVVEQAAVHHDVPADAAIPARAAAVALLCEATAPGRLATVRQHAGISETQASPLLTAELADLTAGEPDVTLLLGHDLARLAGIGSGTLTDAQVRAAQVRAGPAGQPGTGVWWELAGGLAGWRAAGSRVLLADYDQQLGYLCLAALGGNGPPGNGAPGTPSRDDHPHR